MESNKLLKLKPEVYLSAHRCSSHNKQQIAVSQMCGCFSCEQIFRASEVEAFVKEQDGESTALCPYCGTDAGIGDAFGYPLTKEFLKEMNRKWF